MKKSRKFILGDEFSMEGKDAKSLIFQLDKYKARMTYFDRNLKRNGIITKPFDQIFNTLNSRLLDVQSNIILPTGCIFRGTRDNGNEVFLVQDEPKIRSFRLSNTLAVKQLVSKMYDKFNAQTRVLKKNEVPPGKEEETSKQIALREKYIAKQKLQITTYNNQESKYKLFFRVFFPYTYLAISLARSRNANRGSFAFNSMKAAIAIDPIKTLTDRLYQFPLANVSAGGGVCTGKLPLGDFGEINIKSFVEKMCGYFWNNRFNADISTGPQVYGDINFLGNWFEWEYKTYVDPTSILNLDFEVENIKKNSFIVGPFVYDKDEDSKSFGIIDESILVRSFGSSDILGESIVSISDGRAEKKMTGVASSIEVDGYTLNTGDILKTENKKFKILSFDGYREYDVEDSTLNEKRIVVTHVHLKDENRKTLSFSIRTKVGADFLRKSYARAKNFIERLEFSNGDVYKNGQLVARRIDDEANSNIELNIISSMRERNGKYKIKFIKENSPVIIEEMGEAAKFMTPVEISFTDAIGNVKIENGQGFSYRTKKVFSKDDRPHPYTIGDRLSESREGRLTVNDIEYRKSSARYSYNSPKTFYISYSIESGGEIIETKTVKSQLCKRVVEPNKVKLEVQLPSYIIPSIEEMETLVPTVYGSTLNVFGEHVYQIIAPTETNAQFKIMRSSDGSAQISILDNFDSAEMLMFRPSIEHLKNSIVEVDGVKTFEVRDLFECGSDLEYITFKVGDEVILSSDWNPASKEVSIKKIYDFITIKDRDPRGRLKISNNISTGTREHLILDRYKIYAEENGIDMSDSEMSGYETQYDRGTLYAVIDDGSENISLYPLIDKNGTHYLNGISHVKKEYNGIKSGDFVKANVARIPYFAKKDVDEIVCFVSMNGREMAIMKNGLTMWADIVKTHFKVFHRDKLTETKISFYEGKVREPEMDTFMVIYGDSYFGQMGVPILTKNDVMEPEVHRDDYRNTLFKEIGENNLSSTLNLTKSDLAELIEENGSCHLETFSGFNDISKYSVTCDKSMTSFRVNFEKQLGSKYNSLVHILDSRDNTIHYDACYSINNSSLNNGSAWMPAYQLFTQPVHQWSYYNKPYATREEWFMASNVKISFARFPAPRMLKKSTRDPDIYDMYKYIGPQNRFYNGINSSTDRNQYNRYTNGDSDIRCITNDSFLPKIEE